MIVSTLESHIVHDRDLMLIRAIDWEETDGGIRLLVHTPKEAAADAKFPVGIL